MHRGRYASCLLDEAVRVSDGRVTVWRDSPDLRVASIDDNEDDSKPAVVHLASGSKVRAGRVVVATGPFYHGEALAGLLRPCYSYVMSLSYVRTRAHACTHTHTRTRARAHTHTHTHHTTPHHTTPHHTTPQSSLFLLSFVLDTKAIRCKCCSLYKNPRWFFVCCQFFFKRIQPLIT
jgi:tRNA U34 5-carboxymethylaminomethyl modifying enzyme MnmG/GidA